MQLTMEENEDSTGVAFTLDANGHYQFRADTGQGSVTYRVVQVASPDDTQSQIVAGLSSSQAIIQNLINGSGSTEDANHPRFAYIPTALSSGLDSAQVLETRNATASAISSASGPVYLMMSPEVLQSNQRSIIATRPNSTVKVDPQSRITRDDRRRSTHNEVERRRRDKINQWILQLAKLIPDCAAEQTKQGDSKGGILSKACDYVEDIQRQNREMQEQLTSFEQERKDFELHYEQIKAENTVLREQLRQNGFEIADEL